MRKSLELRNKRGELWEKAKPLLEKLRAGTITAEERKTYDGLNDEIDSLQADVRRLEKAEAIEAEAADPVRPPNPGELREFSTPEIAAAARSYRSAFRGHVAPGKHPLDLLAPQQRSIVEAIHQRWNQAFRAICLKNASDDDVAILTGKHAELRDMGFGTGSEGGYLVPQGFVYELEIAMKWYGDMLNACTFIDTPTGNNLPWPTMNDTAQTGEIIGENAQVTQQDLTIGQLIFYAWKYSTKMVPVSIELMQDSAFGLEGVVKDAFAIRLGRILNTHFTTGSGSSQPNGIVTAVAANDTAAQVWGSTSGPGIGLLAAGSSSNTGGSETGGTTYGTEDLTNLEHSVDKAYRRPGLSSYMAHDLTWRYARQLLDKYGRPIWSAGVSEGAPDRVNGYPIFTNNDMAQLAVNNKTMLFGALGKYKVRRVRQLEVLTLRERFADYGQVAFVGFARFDGNLLDAGTHPVTFMQQAAS